MLLSMHTSSKPNFQHGHPVCLTLRRLSLEMKDLSTCKEDLEIAVATSSDGYNARHPDGVLYQSLPRVIDQ